MRKHPVRRLAALAAAALASACSLAPRYERPELPVAPAYPPALLAAAAREGTSAAATDWTRYFADPQLARLIATALDNNRDLRVAVLAIEQARAQWQIRRADIYPTVGVGASGSRTPGANGSTLQSYSAGLTVSAFELDVFGRIASLRDVALAQYLATEETRRAVQISLVASVANTWLSILADNELLALSRQALATREDSVRLTRLRLEQGVSSALDLRQAESLTEAARATLAQQQRQRLQDENALVLLLGSGIAPDLQMGLATTPLSATPSWPQLPAGLPSDLLVQRPDIRRAEQQLIAANANIGAARANFFPRISLTAGLGRVSTELSGLFEGGGWGVTLAPQLLLPIFDAGRNRAGLDSAIAGRDVAVAQYERSIQVAFREVNDALAGQATLGDQQAALERQQAAEQARLELSDLRYRSGVASYLDLLDAQRSLFGVQQSVVLTRLARLQNQVAVYQVLGGGWTEPAPPSEPGPRLR